MKNNNYQVRTLETHGRQKSFYGKAVIIKSGNRVFLQSYNTIVAYIYGGKLFRTWDGWSKTTSLHIDAFCREYGIDAPSKKACEAMTVKPVDVHAVALNYTTRFYNNYWRW